MPSEIATLQRARLILAVSEVVQEGSYQSLTVSKVIARARVSRKTFYDTFASREDCFLAVLEQAVGRARERTVAAYAEHDSWRKGVRAALASVLALMQEEPALARVCIVDALSGGAQILRFRTALLHEIACVIDRAREDAPTLRPPPAITAEAVVGGLASVLHNRLRQQAREPLGDLLGSLMSIIVLPYLGVRAAAEELRKAPTRPRERARPSIASESDPLEGLGIRLTYRTVRTLTAIAQCPGASNRAVAQGAGIADQGQVSKLLARLARLDLVENEGAGQARGEANAWRLTDRGKRLYRAAWST
jgi:AcrR family transcriptional regulator/DNA-binding MarR family transcriptional regulator